MLKKKFAATLAGLAIAAIAGCAALQNLDIEPGSGNTAPPAAASGQAVDGLESLKTKGRAPKTGYDRDEFGPAWKDVDGNGCGTRDDILNRDLDQVETSDECKVQRGILNDPYTGTEIEYTRGASRVDIDHVVALSNAWTTGAFRWDEKTRTEFANDPYNLLAVQDSANRQKGDGDAATWLPKNKEFRCEYVARQIGVKQKYQLWVTKAERESMLNVLATCPGQRIP